MTRICHFDVSSAVLIRTSNILVGIGCKKFWAALRDMKTALRLFWVIYCFQLGEPREQFAVDNELIGDIEDLLVYKEELNEDEEEDPYDQINEDVSEKNFIYDYDGANFGLLPPSNKRFDSFFDQRAREKYLIQNLPPNMADTIKDDTFGKVKTKRSRVSTLKQLIKLCRKSDDAQDNQMTEAQMSNLNRVMQKFSTAPVYGKRFGSFLEQQNRSKNLLKKVKLKDE